MTSAARLAAESYLVCVNRRDLDGLVAGVGGGAVGASRISIRVHVQHRGLVEQLVARRDRFRARLVPELPRAAA
jgi:hypothetical protein